VCSGAKALNGKLLYCSGKENRSKVFFKGFKGTVLEKDLISVSI
jgi:hypothetical protein